MPYIGTEDRGKYSEDLDKLKSQAELSELTVEEKAQAGARLVLQLLETSYPESPRYFQHNEAVGMLKCCSLEWQRRNEVEGFFTSSEFLETESTLDLTSSRTTIQKVGETVAELPSEVKPGVLNYFITVFFKNLFGELSGHTKDLPVSVLETILDHWYESKTAPYEDQKIQENGDV